MNPNSPSGSSLLVGEHPLIAKIKAVVQRVANTDATVLITGESGTGKELVARELHALGPRGREAFVAVNCAALPGELLESELFGHMRGAFTGALASRKGMFQLAHGGTIFLDEIGEMPLSLQAKLLRVLQERMIWPVGAEHPVPVDVRIIAATNKDLRTQIQTRAFREDLFYRLQVIPIHLPPLRARRSDIPLLVNHFLDKANQRYHRQVQITTETMVWLWEYDWPGNVREVENLVEQLVILASGNQVTPEDLPPHIVSAVSTRHLAPPMLADEDDLDITRAVEALERRYIEKALSRANGNKSMAAQLLKLNRTTFLAKLRRIYRDTVPAPSGRAAVYGSTEGE
ncbi:MAG: sigma-54 dependent transcriptional regulator [Candidatus Binatia bacterium]|nr:sigma-54 dependent transcriptional regulator [Candidatus Binatia bacterium]